MNKEEFYDIIEKIDNCLDFYEGIELNHTKFYLELENDENLEIKYEPNNIAHLLGINTDYLRATGLYSGNSYEILNNMINNPNSLLNKIENGIIDPNRLFSKHINSKLDNFKNICGIKIFDTEFIVKYKKDNNLRSNMPLDDGYYIGYINQNNLSIVGFEKNDSKGIYNPHTNLLFENNNKESNEFLNRLFKNQTVTTARHLRRNKILENGKVISNNYFYNNRDKTSKLRGCKRYAELYNGISNTISSNIFYVEKVINLTDEKHTTFSILEEISEKIKKGEFIDFHTLEKKYDYIDESLLNVIGAHNDSLVDTNNNNKTYSYQNLIKEYEEMKEKLLNHDNLIKKITEENKQLTDQNKLLQEENNTLKEEKEKIRRILS